MKLRSVFREALTNMHRLHRESGEERHPFLSIPKMAFVRPLLTVPHGGSGRDTG